MEPNGPQNETTAAAAKRKAAFELFELCAAILLGLGATLSTFAGYQNGLWGGKSAESFNQSSSATTESADAGTYADAQINGDAQVKLEAMILASRAEATDDEAERTLLLHQISELYLREYSDEAYDFLELPAEPRKKYDATGELADLPAEAIFVANHQDFGKKYYGWMYERKVKHAEEARALYERAQREGTMGDRFALNGVYYTLALFFAGLALVFKSRVRWAFLLLGALILLFALASMLRLTFA